MFKEQLLQPDGVRVEGRRGEGRGVGCRADGPFEAIEGTLTFALSGRQYEFAEE